MLSDARKKLSEQGFGGSEIAAVCGLSRCTTPHEIWARRCCPELYQEKQSHHLERGIFGEPMLRAWLSHRLGKEIVSEAPQRTYVCSDRICYATPDGIVISDGKPDSLAEFKFPHWRSARDMDDGDGGIIIPDDYLCQVQWELTAVRSTYNEIDRNYFAAFIDGDLRYTIYHHDDELEKLLLAKAHWFWDAYIKTGKQPPITPSNAADLGDFIKLFWRKNNGKFLDNPPLKLGDMLKNAYELKENLRYAESQWESAKNELLAIIGEHDGVEIGEFKATWKASKSSAKLNYKSLVDELLASLSESQREETTQRHTSIAPGVRRFLLTKKESE